MRQLVGPGIPVLATLDLHANVSRRMVANASVLVAYRTNPHVDAAERGAEMRPPHARNPRRREAGCRLRETADDSAFGHPQNTKRPVCRHHRVRPVEDRRPGDERLGRERLLLGDTPKNGMSVTVTTRGDATLAGALAKDIARKCWAERNRYVPHLTNLADATQMALDSRRDAAKPFLIFRRRGRQPGRRRARQHHGLDPAGVSPGRRQGALLGIFFDPALAARRTRSARARLACPVQSRRDPPAVGDVRSRRGGRKGLHDGNVVGRRGIAAGHDRAGENGPVAHGRHPASWS
ncbi:MAG: M81 family metallopeptidase [Betaproteobacteria bacterium]|nr:M81 family metallopeptidase [Betaproteobacteria bacterium]